MLNHLNVVLRWPSCFCRYVRVFAKVLLLQHKNWKCVNSLKYFLIELEPINLKNWKTIDELLNVRYFVEKISILRFHTQC